MQLSESSILASDSARADIQRRRMSARTKLRRELVKSVLSERRAARYNVRLIVNLYSTTVIVSSRESLSAIDVFVLQNIFLRVYVLYVKTMKFSSRKINIFQLLNIYIFLIKFPNFVIFQLFIQLLHKIYKVKEFFLFGNVRRELTVYNYKMKIPFLSIIKTTMAHGNRYICILNNFLV